MLNDFNNLAFIATFLFSKVQMNTNASCRFSSTYTAHTVKLPLLRNSWWQNLHSPSFPHSKLLSRRFALIERYMFETRYQDRSPERAFLTLPLSLWMVWIKKKRITKTIRRRCGEDVLSHNRAIILLHCAGFLLRSVVHCANIRRKPVTYLTHVSAQTKSRRNVVVLVPH